MRRIAFVTYEFSADNLRKQPWNYVWRLCEGLVRNNHHCVVISDGGDGTSAPLEVGGLPVYRVGRIRPRHWRNVMEVLNRETIDLVVWSFTPRSVAFSRVFRKIGRPLVLYMSLPLYTPTEVVRAQRVLGKYNLCQYFQNCLVPGAFVRRIIASNRVGAVVAASARNRERLMSYGCEEKKVWLVRHGFERSGGVLSPDGGDGLAGLEKADRGPDERREKIALYLGGADKIRGLFWLIRAFTRAAAESSGLRLVILVRTDDAHLTEDVESEVARKGIAGRASVIGGILPANAVRRYLADSDFVVLPFILVPSEVPISILEAMDAGKPVIATDLDGVPELIANRGICVRPGDSEALKDAILRLAGDPVLLKELSDNCRSYMEKYPTWHEIGREVSAAIEEI